MMNEGSFSNALIAFLLIKTLAFFLIVRHFAVFLKLINSDVFSDV